MIKPLSKNKLSQTNNGPGTRGGIERILKIAFYLQTGHIDGHKITCRTLGQEFEVDRSTIMRDLAFLRDRLKMEFEWDKDEQGYVLTDNGNHIPRMQLDEVDKLLLSIMEHIVSGIDQTELGIALQSSFKKILALFTGKNPAKSLGIPVQFPSMGGGPVSDLKVFHLTQRAISSSVALKILCQSSEQNSLRMIHLTPTGVCYLAGKWVLQGTVAGTPEKVFFQDITELALERAHPPEANPDIVESSQKVWRLHYLPPEFPRRAA